MANFRIHRNTKMKNGYYYRESYSLFEYLVINLFNFFVIFPWKILLSSSFYLLKLIFLSLRFLLSRIRFTKEFSQKIGNKNYLINNLNKFFI